MLLPDSSPLSKIHWFFLPLAMWFSLPAMAASLTLQIDDQIIEYSTDKLLALGEQQLDTETPWTDGVQHFKGVALKTLLDKHHISNGTLVITALNDYRASVPVKEAVQYGGFIATHLNGEAMRIRDKGPFWLVFPWSEHAQELDTREIKNWSVWQIADIQYVTP